MYSKFHILLLVSLITLTAKAQQIPAHVSKWINTELAKGKNKTVLKDYTSDRFFSPDSARIIGYIKGYDTTLKFTSGIIYMENVITREDYPTVVAIHPDGRFEVAVEMMHPKNIKIAFDGRYWVPVYVEPGQVVAMVFDWEILTKHGADNIAFTKTILYGGPTAQINTELGNIERDRFDYEAFQQQVKTLTPDAYKSAIQTKWNNARRKLEAQLSGKQQPQVILWNDASEKQGTQLLPKQYLQQTKTILRNEIDIDYGTQLLDFIMKRDYDRKKDTANKALAVRESAAFYDFLSENNYNRQELFIANGFSTFVNRVEYSKPFWEARTKPTIKLVNDTAASTGNKPSTLVLNQLKPWQISDTLLPNKYGIKPGFLYELCKVRSTKFVFENSLKGKKDEARVYLTQLENGISHPFLQKETERLFHRKFSDAGRSYTLPDNQSAAVFKNIISQHKGKMLFVDFWATSCGPCVGNIKAQLSLRDKYKNNPDFDFVFITSEDESPLNAYEKFIGEQALTNTYRIDADDYLSLRELFKFNGIPRYVLIDKDGKILNDDFEMYNFQSELPKLFPGKVWQ